MYNGYTCVAKWLDSRSPMMARLNQSLRQDRFRSHVQGAYLLAFAFWAVWPNLVLSPSVLMVIVLALTLIWFLGVLGTWLDLPHADELMLCGSLGPIMVGVVQLGYRLQFLWTHQSMAMLGTPSSAATGFAFVWAYETVVILLPGVLFTVWNARKLRPLPPSKIS